MHLSITTPDTSARPRINAFEHQKLDLDEGTDVELRRCYTNNGRNLRCTGWQRARPERRNRAVARFRLSTYQSDDGRRREHDSAAALPLFKDADVHKSSKRLDRCLRTDAVLRRDVSRAQIRRTDKFPRDALGDPG